MNFISAVMVSTLLGFCFRRGDEDGNLSDNKKAKRVKSSSTASGLLCNFEESILNGRLKPFASVKGFQLQISKYLLLKHTCYGRDSFCVFFNMISFFSCYWVILCASRNPCS